ncbi:MAG TPA: peptidylprolyl isomerase [Desulfuromonadales bacterium]|nr:peptidylprolyl isomerase [Desulfuromonadales bacterium]
MSQTEKKAKVHYTGSLSDGTVFDSSRERKEPLEFTVGAGQVIKGFDDAVADMGVGDKKTVTVPADEAYGPYREDMVFEVESTQFAEGVVPEVGMQLQGQAEEDAAPMIVTVKKIEDEKVTLDANHPLAGQDLTFEIELVEVA